MIKQNREKGGNGDIENKENISRKDFNPYSIIPKICEIGFNRE